PAATSSRLLDVSNPSWAGFSSTAVASASPARTALVTRGPRVGRTSGSLSWARARAGKPMSTATSTANVYSRRPAASGLVIPAEYSHERQMQNWDRPPADIAVAELF